MDKAAQSSMWAVAPPPLPSRGHRPRPSPWLSYPLAGHPVPERGVLSLLRGPAGGTNLNHLSAGSFWREVRDGQDTYTRQADPSPTDRAFVGNACGRCDDNRGRGWRLESTPGATDTFACNPLLPERNPARLYHQRVARVHDHQ